jgi:general L-amino acid transport system substrate-binding protein
MPQQRKIPYALALVSAIGAAFALVPATAHAGVTLDAIRARGAVICGITNQPAMSSPDNQGRWTGFHADICRAFAIAVFNDPDKVRFVPVTAQQRFTALQSGEIDVLDGTNALTLTRDATLGLTTPATVFITGQGFLVNKRLNAKSAADLNGATICAIQGSEIERNVQDYVNKVGLKMQTVAFDTDATMLSAFYAGRCDAVSNDMVSLSANLYGQANRSDFVLLPDLIAKEPHGPMVRTDDAQWMTLVRWSVFAFIQAEEMGLTKANVEAARASSPDPKVKRFLGLIDNPGRGFGIADSFAFDIIRRLGNYGELFDRYAGKGGLGMDRGPNRLWTDGGVLISNLWQ